MMSSIITITLNPAIDKSTSIAALIPEKKIKCADPLFQPGGGGINVARAIKNLGGNATAIYLAGGYTGKFFTEMLEREAIDSVIIDTTKQTRENLIVFDNTTGLQYRFGMPGPKIEDMEWKKLLSTIEKIKHIDYLVASGSVPQGIPLDIYARIAAIAKKKKAKCIVDTSGEALLHAADEGVYLLKPNLGEMASLIGSKNIDSKKITAFANDLIAKKRCEVLVVSMGAAGAMLITKDEVKKIIAPIVKRKGTVGAGDSMVAGIVLSLSKGEKILTAVRYGIACGSAATMNPGTQLCNLADVNKLYKHEITVNEL